MCGCAVRRGDRAVRCGATACVRPPPVACWPARAAAPRALAALADTTVPKCSNRMCVNVCSNAYEIYLGTQCYCMLRFTTHS